MTVCEVNLARIYNETVRRNAIAKKKQTAEKNKEASTVA